MDIILTTISIIGALIILGIIIMVHELGHYSIGRACKIKIVEFAVGFGPKIKSWIKKDIIYSIRWIWLGGFTKFYGEDEEVNDKWAFNNQPAGRRALTIAAGPVFNIIFAFLLVIIVLPVFGEYAPTIKEVLDNSPAQAAGLQEGDVILEMNGVEMDFAMEIDSALRAGDGVAVPITVLRDGQEFSYNIPTQYYEEYDANLVGITKFGSKRVTFGFWEAVGLSGKWVYFVVRETLIMIAGLFAGKGMEGGTGVVGVLDMLGQALRSSFELVLRLGVLINISLATINLLPLPALDGGRLVFIGIEKVFRKPVPRNVEGVIHFIGFVLLICFMIFITFKDISRWFSG